MKFSVPDMSCGHCKAAISEAVKTADGMAELEFDMPGRVVTITSTRTPEEIAKAVKDAGYDTTLLQQA